MRPLEGCRIGLLESRKADDLAALIARFGGTAISAPSVREVRREGDVGPALDRLAAGELDVLVVLTAAASDALLAEAGKRNRRDAIVEVLRQRIVACRGPKPLVALKRAGIVPQVITAKPHTTDELLAALLGTDLHDRRVLVLHYGERSDAMSAALRSRGALVDDLCLYDWALPEDVEPVRALIGDAIEGRLDALVFTSQVQFRHLLQIASEMRREADLVAALRDTVIVGSVGPVCTRALRASGIVPDVMPASPNGPSLIQAVADYVSIRRGARLQAGR